MEKMEISHEWWKENSRKNIFFLFLASLDFKGSHYWCETKIFDFFLAELSAKYIVISYKSELQVCRIILDQSFWCHISHLIEMTFGCQLSFALRFPVGHARDIASSRRLDNGQMRHSDSHIYLDCDTDYTI